MVEEELDEKGRWEKVRSKRKEIKEASGSPEKKRNTGKEVERRKNNRE